MPCATCESTAVVLYQGLENWLERGGRWGGSPGPRLVWTQAGQPWCCPQTSSHAWHTERLGCCGLFSLVLGTLPRKVKRWLWVLGRDMGGLLFSDPVFSTSRRL